MQEEKDHIARCRVLIENKIGWGDGEAWQSQDFENLSQRIFEETNVMLSSSTLKRIWGRVKYDSSPNRATLDVLARFVGFGNWLEFVHADPAPGRRSETTERSSKTNDRGGKGRLSMRIKRLAIAAAILLLVIFGLVALRNMNRELRFQDVVFTTRAVTSGLPNTVIFNYDAENSNADSVFIQQSWDPRKKFRVDKQLHEYASTYYYPGYYKAKLILNDSVVGLQDVYIETDGWIGTIEQEPLPIYLPKSLFEKKLKLTSEDLDSLHFDYRRQAPVFTLTQVDKQWDLASDHMLFEATLQNTYDEPNAVCGRTQVLIMGTDGVISIPLSKKGCVGEIGLMLGMNYIDGKTHDLSGFGVDFLKPVTLKCEAKDHRIHYWVDGREVYSHDFAHDIGKIVGMQIRFIGTGTVEDVNLRAIGE